MMVRGSVDSVTSSEVRGWAYSPGRSTEITVQAILNREIIGEAVATSYRPDLAAAGVGDGNSGFEIKLFRSIDAIYLPFVSVTVDGGDAELPRAPTLGYREFFLSVYSSHPTCGRSRSVFGGLWTDRTDASAILKGKLAINQLDEGAASRIDGLIRDGFATLTLEIAPKEKSWQQLLQSQIERLLNSAPLSSLLRSVLDDKPVVIRDTWQETALTPLRQPSGNNPSPSPAECVEIIVPLSGTVAIEVVRNSHTLPEFTPYGVSRWASRSHLEGAEMAAENGTILSQNLQSGEVAVVGAGTVYGLRTLAGEGTSVTLLCVPSRSVPASQRSQGE